MQLNQFVDPFQAGHAGIHSGFGNGISSQVGGATDGSPGFGFAQNHGGYEWGDGSPTELYGGHPHAHEFRGNGGYHEEFAGGQDPHALARANLQWEHGGAPPQSTSVADATGTEPDYMAYTGPDDFDFDDEETAPPRGAGFWRKRAWTALIHGLAVGVWVWVWSTFGLSNQLQDTTGSLVFWGFIVFMAYGVMGADHKAARYDEEREQTRATEDLLRLVAQLVGSGAGVVLTLKLMKRYSAGERTAIIGATGASFVSSLIGMAAYTCRKRGRSVRRVRKVKAALLNLSIGFLIVALLLGVRGNVQVGGGVEVRTLPAKTIRYVEPQPKIEVVRQTGGAQFDSQLAEELSQLAPAPSAQPAPVPPAAQLSPAASQQGAGYVPPVPQQPPAGQPPVGQPPAGQPPAGQPLASAAPVMVAPTVRV